MEYRKGPYCHKLYFAFNGHFYSKFNTFTQLQHGFTSGEKNFAILLYFAGSSADWSKYITSFCKINAQEVDDPTSIGSFWSISNVGKSPSIDSSSLWPAVSRIHRSWAVFVVDDVIVFCRFHVIGVHPYPTFTLPYLISSYLSLLYILPYLSLPYLTLHFALPYLTFCLSLPYLTSYLTLPYLLPYILPCLTLPLTLHFALPYLTLYYLLPYVLPYLTLPYLTCYLTFCLTLPNLILHLTLPYILP